MKTATMPALRVDPELRSAAEDLLNDNESLSSFMEAALREGVARRRLQRDFVARGLDSRAQARRDNEYFAADDVHAELESMLNTARKNG
ncbi:YlcI/YnfO family protein [Burkholderia sp. Ax-1719]|jgi:predicted transcriptional regulator|uniref:YlcI/YnfO family protein n=1 Tax=Burkholderia sp. Ax-1719 TaxID=2608334 RepID=UPI0014221FE0|nr:YlcI/YnfO family protein [Burkholderia sp. Ax-1719]NIE68807.1 prevent-host-death protein [Burkholderia sp. Ax-1719]